MEGTNKIRALAGALLLLLVAQSVAGSSTCIVEVGVNINQPAKGPRINCRIFGASSSVQLAVQDALCKGRKSKFREFVSNYESAQNDLVVARDNRPRFEVPIKVESKKPDEPMGFTLMCSTIPDAYKFNDAWFRDKRGGNPTTVQIFLMETRVQFTVMENDLVDIPSITMKRSDDSTANTLPVTKGDDTFIAVYQQRLLKKFRYYATVFVAAKPAKPVLEEPIVRRDQRDHKDSGDEEDVVAPVDERRLVRVVDKREQPTEKRSARQKVWYGPLDINPPLNEMHIGKGAYRYIQDKAGRLPDQRDLHWDLKGATDKPSKYKVSPEMHMHQLLEQYASKEGDLKNSLPVLIRSDSPLMFLRERIAKATSSIGNRILKAAKNATPVNLGMVTEHIRWAVAVLNEARDLDWAVEAITLAYENAGDKAPKRLHKEVQDSIWMAFQNRVYNNVVDVPDLVHSEAPVVPLGPDGKPMPIR